jgi:hypothetical protein
MPILTNPSAVRLAKKLLPQSLLQLEVQPFVV